MSGRYYVAKGGATTISLNERFTNLRREEETRDEYQDVRRTRYDDHQAAAERSKRVQMHMEQRPGVQAALQRRRSRSRTRSRSRSRGRFGENIRGGRPVDIRDRLSLRRGRGGGPIRNGRDTYGAPPMRRRSRSRSRSVLRRADVPYMRRGRSRSRSRSRVRLGSQSRGGYRGGRGVGLSTRGRRPRSLSRSRSIQRNGGRGRGGAPRPLSRAGSTYSLNNGNGIAPRGGFRGRGRSRRDSFVNGITTRGRGRGGRFRSLDRGSIIKARGRSRSIRDVKRLNQGIRGARQIRGGRSTIRGRGRGGRGGIRPTNVSKDELDKQLDQYMATDPLNMDKDLEAYKQDL